MADIKWIKITTDIFDDEKLKLIDTMPARDEIIVVWFKLLSLAGKVNQNGLLFMNSRIAYTDEMLATIFNRELPTVRLALEVFRNFDMITIEENGLIGIVNWEKHQNIDGMDKIREQNRLRQKIHRDKQKQLTNGNVTSRDSHAIDKEEEQEEDKDKENKQSIDDFFERVWKLYPSKKGKGKISATKKKELYKFGEQIVTCIERYKKYAQSLDYAYHYQNGSTFFNSGYVDYLDDNYTEVEVIEAKPTNKFHNHEQRDYDFDTLMKLNDKKLEGM